MVLDVSNTYIVDISINLPMHTYYILYKSVAPENRSIPQRPLSNRKGELINTDEGKHFPFCYFYVCLERKRLRQLTPFRQRLEFEKNRKTSAYLDYFTPGKTFDFLSLHTHIGCSRVVYEI